MGRPDHCPGRPCWPGGAVPLDLLLAADQRSAVPRRRVTSTRARPTRAARMPAMPEASTREPEPVGGNSSGVDVGGGVGAALGGGGGGGDTGTGAAARPSWSAGNVAGGARGPGPKPVAVSVVLVVGLVLTTHFHVSPASRSWLPFVSPVNVGLLASTLTKVVAPPSVERSTCTADSAAGKNFGGVSLVSAIVHAT